jgi:hypothetical protein
MPSQTKNSFKNVSGYVTFLSKTKAKNYDSGVFLFILTYWMFNLKINLIVHKNARKPVAKNKFYISSPSLRLKRKISIKRICSMFFFLLQAEYKCVCVLCEI